MALPQRRDPYEEDREVRRDLNNRDIDRGTGAGLFAWWWIWLLFLIAVIWFAGWGWGGYGGWWGWGGARPVATRTVNTNTQNMTQIGGQGAALLAATDRAAYVGQNVSLQHVQVTNKVNDSVLWIGGGNVQPMLVVLSGAKNSTANANIGQGNWVAVNGTVTKAPAANQATNEWKLSNDGVKRLEQQGAYLQASQMVKSGNQ